MCGKGEARRIDRSGCGKSVVGISRPERSSTTRYLARRMPRIDLLRIAIRPTKKLSPATRKNDMTADHRNRTAATGEAGGFSGKIRARKIEIGTGENNPPEGGRPAGAAITK